MIVTDDLRILLEEREERARERIAGVLDAIEALRGEVRLGTAGVHSRLDLLNGRVVKGEDRINALERHAAVLEGRLSPAKESRRRPGDEEMSIRVTPRMWAALVAVGGVLYTVLHWLFQQWQKTGS